MVARAKKNEEKKREKRKREEEKEENETVTVRETWRVEVTRLGGTSWRSLRTSLMVSLILMRMCVWCLM